MIQRGLHRFCQRWLPGLESPASGRRSVADSSRLLSAYPLAEAARACGAPFSAPTATRRLAGARLRVLFRVHGRARPRSSCCGPRNPL